VTRRHAARGGFTLVELIVALAVGALVTGSVFAALLVLYRIDDTWQNRSQARSIGLLAEQTLEQDIQSNILLQAGPQTLVLQSPSTISPAVGEVSGYCVQYSIRPGPDPSLPLLVRSVTDPSGATLSVQTVAHGVTHFTAVANGQQVSVTLTLSVAGGGNPISVTPVLTGAARNSLGGNIRC